MNQLDVKIVRLQPMRVAAAYGFGASPEAIAWDKILAFADANGLLGEGKTPRFFGFDNPVPTPGSPNYGYEQWITVGPDVRPAGDIKIKDFPGGLFAVTRCKLNVIFETWQQLGQWLEQSRYEMGSMECLEESITPPRTPFDDMVMDLYLSIAE